ncbi:MAG: GntG family PLP-dependent aldolase [Flavobacteriales bacterium]
MIQIDLRSDTVTRPTPAMKEAMMNAPLGDDVFSEDPTINELQRYAAELFGMEDALYCSSGTQTNQIAINVHTTPGDEVICSNMAHVSVYEGGGIALNSGCSVALLEGDRGRITADQVKNHINPDDIHRPITRLVCVEDTMNKGGGAIYAFDEIKKIAKVCKENNLAFHCDGARLFNALVATGISPKEYGAQFDSISICLSKGLGAPVGSLLLGTKSFIQKARRRRKSMGGGMRQAGIIAAAGLYALKHHVDRLKIDHDYAAQLGGVLEKCASVESVLPVETNIVIFQLKAGLTSESVVAKLAENGILCFPFGPDKIRMVTHLDLTSDHYKILFEKLPSVL